jgi:hypothetical protein
MGKRSHLNDKLVMMAHARHPSCMGSVNGKMTTHARQGKNMRPYPKITKIKRVGAMVQVVECLLNKHEVLSSNPRNERDERERETDQTEVFNSPVMDSA